MKPKHPISRYTAILLLTLLAACQTNAPKAEPPKDTVQQRVQDGKALWEEKCRTVAGEKIYRKVEGVEGVLLMKVRPMRGEREWADRNWPGAAMAQEFPGNTYIESFLLYEVGRQTPHRGHVDSTVSSLPGYRWVEVIDEKDGQRYRYTGSDKVVGRKDVNAPNVKVELERNPNYDLNVYRYVLDKTPATSPPPRYGVTYEDHVIPEERYLGIASSTIKVIDLKTNEVLGEMTRYAWSPGAPSRINPSPWLSASKCGGEEIGSATRFFVDKVLIPAMEK